MTKDEFDAIVGRARAAEFDSLPGDPSVVIICVDKRDEPIHPDSLGPEKAARFKRRAQALADSGRDRRKLLEWIFQEFELPEEWRTDARETTGRTVSGVVEPSPEGSHEKERPS